jgi:outer membrane receptor protein involved in Fe transport
MRAGSRLAVLLLGGVSLFATTPALAQSASPSTAGPASSGHAIEEIVVTARKRSESLQDVPVAVSAIPKAVLVNNATTELNKIGEMAPQVMIGRATTGTGAVITIRGISSASTDSGLDQSVALDIDGVAISRGRIIQSTMFDTQQIEVLEGPQALFFGKNSPAGVISVESVDPGNVFEGYAKAGYEFEAKEKYVEGAVGGPVTDNLKVRLAARYDTMDGWIRNIAVPTANPFQPAYPTPGALQGRKQPKGHDLGGRLTVIWTPTNDFSAKFKLFGSKQKVNSLAPYTETFCTGGQTIPVTLGVPQPGGDCELNKTVVQTSTPPAFVVNYPYANGGVPYQRTTTVLSSLVLTKTFGAVTLTSTSGYYDELQAGSFNGDYSPFSQIYDSEYEHYRMFNEELRVNTEFSGPLNAMAGLYYEHATRHWLNAPDILNIFDPLAQNYATTVTTSDNVNKSYSAFGQLRWKILPTLELDGGARYTHDVRDTTLINVQTNTASPLGAGLRAQGVPLYPHYSGDNVSPEVTLTWKPNRDQTLYAAYKVGYKSGGISSAALLPNTSTAENVVFGPEKAKGFEVGYKAYFFERTLRMDLTAYRYNYLGLQVSAFDSIANRFSLRNAAKARITGITGSFDWRATDALSFNGNFGWNRARYVSFPNAQCYVGQTPATGCFAVPGGTAQDLSGRPLNRAPKLTYKIGADYRADLPQGWTADLAASANYSSSYYTAADYSPGGPQKSFWLLNAAVHVSPANERFTFSVIGRNLTNTYYKVFTSNQSLGTVTQFQTSLNRPREVLAEVQYKF